MASGSRLKPAVGLGATLVALWLAGLLGVADFGHERTPRRSPAPRARPILPGDVPPGPVVTLASGRERRVKWFFVASAGENLRCFGLAVNIADRFGLACNREALDRREGFGGTVFVPSALSKPIVIGEVSPNVTSVEAHWGHGELKTARLVGGQLEQVAGVKYFVTVLPRHVRRIDLLARDAASDVVGRQPVCCPVTGWIRQAAMVPICHGRIASPRTAPVVKEPRSELEELMGCPPIDLVTNVDYVSPT